MLHRSLRNMAADVIDQGDEGQGGRFGAIFNENNPNLPNGVVFESVRKCKCIVCI